jgi:Tol biopolymer transport system component
VAVAIDDGQRNDIWLWDLARRKLGRLTSDSASGFSPVWTRDGHRLLFFSLTGLFRQPTDGIGEAERLGTGLPSGVTPDGRGVIFSLGGLDLMIMALDGTGHVEPLIQTPFDERNGVVSPDSHWLAYESNSSGRFEIYVRPFPNVNVGQRLISSAGGTRPLWAPSGRELFYVAADGAIMAVAVDPRGGTWSAGSPAKVVQGPYSTLSSLSPRTYDVSTDGKRFLVVKQPPNPAVDPRIVVVLNWLEELKQRVPVK